MSDPVTSVLSASNLTKAFGSNTALDNFNLSVAKGEIVCLLGANGAGKTTTINLFLDFLQPDSGDVSVLGRSVSEDPAKARAAIGYVAEIVSLYPTLSGRENLDFFHALSGNAPISDRERETLLTRLEFPMRAIDAPVSTYSKGMRQKLGLAIAVAKKARAILLDEPLSGLDPKAANNLVTVLRQIASEGVALLLSTHDIFRAKEVADRIGIMSQGQLIDLVDANSLSAADLEALYLRHMTDEAA
ncbi:ABC transporter ATP-binding protein [Litorimonas haliclonae]|uniref:ABC transporter ATP-binding protein n=1 Tax=Litorimonas haliclonae TaxID=2081977 RepID=UPI0039F14C60